MAKKIDLVGKQFGSLTVIKEEKTSKKGRYWQCKCSCGNSHLKSIRQDHLLKFETTSCRKCQWYRMIGQTYGKLTILDVNLEYCANQSPIGKREKHNIFSLLV